MREAALSFIVSGQRGEERGGREERRRYAARPWHSQSRSYCRVSEKKGSARGVG